MHTPTDPAAPEERSLEEAQEQLIAAAVQQVEAGAEPAQTLEALLAQLPAHVWEEVRRRFGKKLEQSQIYQQRLAKEREEKEKRRKTSLPAVGDSLKAMFADIAARLKGKLNPQELEVVKSVGQQLTARGVLFNEIIEVSGHSMGGLSPSLGQGQAKEQEIGR